MQFRTGSGIMALRENQRRVARRQATFSINYDRSLRRFLCRASPSTSRLARKNDAGLDYDHASRQENVPIFFRTELNRFCVKRILERCSKRGPFREARRTVRG